MTHLIQRRTLRNAPLSICLLALLMCALLTAFASATTPEGPVLSAFTNTTKIVQNGTQRTDGRGTINYAMFTSTQQNVHWKAYVGNVTGTLVLADAEGFNIYDWKLSSLMTGNIIASRNNTLNWPTVTCLNYTHIAQEHQSLQFTSSQADNINFTLNATNHAAFSLDGVPLTGCPSVSTFQNSTRQSYNVTTNVFQEIGIADNFSRVAYMTAIYPSIGSYRTQNLTNFQLLIPDTGNSSNSATQTYYFFVELT